MSNTESDVRSSEPRSLERLKEIAEEWHGHRIAVASQYLRQGELKQAKIAQAEADVCYRLIKLIEDMQNGEEYERKSWSYVEISRAYQECQEEVREKNEENSVYERGLE